MRLSGCAKRWKTKGQAPASQAGKSRKKTVRYDKRRYKRRSRIEIMFSRLKDWRRVATRYDRCPLPLRYRIGRDLLFRL